MSIEAKKKYEFLESISAIMDAHLRYFKLVGSLILHFESLPSKTKQIWHMCPVVSWSFFQGYDLLGQLEPYIHQVQNL